MFNVSKYSYDELHKQCVAKQVHFTSDCEFFPMFDVTVKVLSMSMNGTEIIFHTKTSKGKLLTIGSHMKNLRFEVCS